MKYLLLFFTFLTYGQIQKFVPIDDDTLEFIDQATYRLYSNKIEIYSSLTSKDSITRLPKEIAFDSIVFFKLNYQERGLKKENLEQVVKLKKLVYELDEVIVSNSKPKEIAIGEKNRFIKKYSRPLQKELQRGLIFREADLKNLTIKRLNFFVEKVKYKTTYKIKFYNANETGNFITGLNLQVNELIYESPVLTLEPGTKNKVEVDQEDYKIDTKDKNIFVCLELQDYYDDSNTIIKPANKELTRLKFQLSNFINYYDKMIDIDTKILTDEIININAMVNQDFANMINKKPHKSNLVAPAIILYAVKKR